MEQGPEDGRPVVLIHGFPEFWWSWRHQMQALADAGYRAVAMDLRGFGDSDAPAETSAYALPASLQDVGAVVASVGGSATIVCHDWGGAVGWVYASIAPQQVERLVVMNAPHPGGLSDALYRLPQMQASWYMFFFQFEGVAEEALSRNGGELLRRWFYDTASVPLGDDVIARYLEVFSRPGAITAGLNWYRANVPPASWLARTGGDAMALPPITCPTLVLWGADDAYLTYEVGAHSGEFVQGPFALQTLADTGHWIQQERPDEVNRYLLEFLRSS